MSEPKPNPFSVWFHQQSEEDQQAWRDKLAAVPHYSHEDCTHPNIKTERRRCRRARRRADEKAAREQETREQLKAELRAELAAEAVES